MISPGDFNQVSKAERDRRWQKLQEEMSARGVDCLLVSGTSGRWNEMHANVRYVSNYADNLSTASYAIFPLQGDGTLVTQMSVKRSNLAQCWFNDIRGMSTINLQDVVMERLNDLGLTKGTLGLAGMAFRDNENIGMPWNLYQAIREKLPNLNVVDVTDIFFDMRSIKSDEEIACLQKSAELSDIAFKAHIDLAHPGITEREYCAGVIYAVDAAGAEPPTFLLLNSGPMPGDPLMGDPGHSNRIIQKGDVICSEIGPKWAGYQAQMSQCISLGSPTVEMVELTKYAAEIFHKMADKLRPGNAHSDALHAGDDVVELARKKFGSLADGFHPIASAAGLGGPDPTPRTKELQPNQAFNIHIGHGAATPQHLYGGYCVVVTTGEPRHLSKYSVEETLLTVVE